MTETEACIALNMVPKMGPVRLRRLLAAFGTPEQVLLTSADKLQQVDGIGPDVARSVASWESQIDLSEELRAISDFGASVVTQNSPGYPRQLREIHDPPIGYKGQSYFIAFTGLNWSHSPLDRDRKQ